MPGRRKQYDCGGVLPDSGMEVRPLDVHARGVTVSRTKNPARRLTWGQARTFVSVQAGGPFGFACLRFRVPPTTTGHLFSGTIVAARWNPVQRRFRLIPASGYDENAGYIYAQIDRAGIFGAFGLPRDPRLILALRLLAAMRPWAPMARAGGASFAAPLIGAALGHPLMKELASGKKLLGTFGLESADFHGVPAGKEAPRVDELDDLVERMPEMELLDAVDEPHHRLNSVLRLPGGWPDPRGGWRSLGPLNVTGRIKALAIDPRDGNVIYAGAAGGAVWKTTDGGRDWFETARDDGPLAIGGLGMAASDPDVLYAATGEWTGGVGWPINPAVMGTGVYRTRNGGRTWERCASIESSFCSSVAVDPTDPEVVFVGGDVGLHRSRDGGETWDVPQSNRAGRFEPGPISDVVIAHDEPMRCYVGVHGKGVWRSHDGGESWEPLASGIEAAGGTPGGRDSREDVANAPKIALGRDGAHGSRFVAVKMANRVYVSTDGGDSFERRTDARRAPAAFYSWCNLIAVDPRDEGILYAGSIDLDRSDEGGGTWRPIAGELHEDQQALAFDPLDSNRLILANDGGVWESTDRGEHWFLISDGLIAAQFYDVSVSQGPKLRVAGAMHDESAHASDGERVWESFGLLEGGSVAVDPNDADVVYHGSYFNRLHRFVHGERPTMENLDLRVSPSSVQAVAVAKGRPDSILALEETSGSFRETVRNRVVRHVADAAPPWRVVLPEQSAPYVAVAFALSDPDVAYAATRDGQLWRSSDGGSAWSEITPRRRGLSRADAVAVDGSEPGRVYLAGAAEDGEPRVLRVEAGPAAPEVIALGGPGERSAGPREVVALATDPALESVLYCATRSRVWRSIDGGRNWRAFDRGMRAGAVTGLAIQPWFRTLYAATLGNGMVFRRI